MSLIVVQRPHQTPMKVWWAETYGEILERMYSGGAVTHYDLDYADNVLEDEDALEIAREHGSVVEVMDCPSDNASYEYYAPGDAPSEREIAERWVDHDMRQGTIFEGAEDVVYVLESGSMTGEHPRSVQEFKRIARLFGWLDEESDEDDEEEA